MTRRKASNRRALVTSIAAVATVIVLCLVVWANFFWQKPQPQNTPELKSAETLTGQMDTFTSAEHSISFTYPGEWTAEEIINKKDTSVYSSTVTVKTANDRVVAVLSTGGQLGGACPASAPELDVSTFDGSKEGMAGLPDQSGYRYTVVKDVDGVFRTGYGVTSSPENRSVKLKCPALNVNNEYRVSPNNKKLGTVSFGLLYSRDRDGYSSLESAEAYMESDEYHVIRDMITSLSIDS
ncbi:MAG: hypothetical protein EOO17_00610 [Chloroflexi bacterium]|nr:MAG: hypothetical protein EOO17_00610 [Chloroflexota bacterium]